MYIYPKIVFKTPFYTPQYNEFRNPSELARFLTGFDFMRPHEVSNMSIGRPEFQLGTKLEFVLDGYFCESDVKWGPRFLVARRVYDCGGRMFAEVPSDKPTSELDATTVFREYRPMQIFRGMVDAIVDIRDMHQLWPKCEASRSEYVKFLTKLSRQKYRIRTR